MIERIRGTVSLRRCLHTPSMVTKADAQRRYRQKCALATGPHAVTHRRRDAQLRRERVNFHMTTPGPQWIQNLFILGVPPARSELKAICDGIEDAGFMATPDRLITRSFGLSLFEY